tara:strand:- start:1687 stop:1803 length:117 start_codon:yes stop_codon:yes gene_type:complete
MRDGITKADSVFAIVVVAISGFIVGLTGSAISTVFPPR